RTKQWCPQLLLPDGDALAGRLGDPASPTTCVGKVASYWQQKYGFRADCIVVACVGDNGGSLAGMRLQQGDLALSLGTKLMARGIVIVTNGSHSPLHESLGTSDTLFAWVDHPVPRLEGHILCSP